MRKNNHGFSLVELIVIIAIMAILVAVLAPRLVKYIERSKRVVDVENAKEFIDGAQRVLAERKLDTKNDGVHYTAAVAWNKDSKFNRDNPKNLLDYFAIELTELPLSKAHPDYYWFFVYDQDCNPQKLYIKDKLGDSVK